MVRKLGYLPDPRKRPNETPDKDADEVLSAAPVPPSSDNVALTKVVDQGGLGSCVANAIGQAVYGSHRKQGVQSPKFLSRLFAYYVSRLYHHETNRDSGTFLRTCIAGLNKFGFCPEDVWPYDDGPSKFKRMPPTAVFHAAFDQRSPTVYHRIYSEGRDRLDDIKRALGKGYLVAFGTDVSNDFCSDVGTDKPIDPPVGKTIAGGHAMCFVGHQGDTFKVINSWGTNWGLTGYCDFTGDYVAWGGTRDIWIIEHAPRYSS